MLINSLEEMEAIVENNASLSWDGWTVVQRTVSPTGWMDKNGVFINNVWHVQKRFQLSEQGWDIPTKLGKKNAK